MSSDRRPAKVRVVSAGQGDGVALQPNEDLNPGRRRGDRAEADAVEVAGAVLAAGSRQGGSLLWVFGALMLFLVGAAIGGALLVISGIVTAEAL
ncbi:hypothetical protein [Novosphingobium guangzhouense]|uniref:Uncharacterized protein n=1 Tax=Novosphingobium guangzhouense TaxID=1850347 RepID=A0A2K2FSV1_9SPHN|nr:hypothetical protein [Novosphingobium guangzhouense]PNU01863.1 hypothetical protein A8V01_27170 [Novosphingobium guangzhouense]